MSDSLRYLHQARFMYYSSCARYPSTVIVRLHLSLHTPLCHRLKMFFSFFFWRTAIYTRSFLFFFDKDTLLTELIVSVHFFRFNTYGWNLFRIVLLLLLLLLLLCIFFAAMYPIYAAVVYAKRKSIFACIVWSCCPHTILYFIFDMSTLCICLCAIVARRPSFGLHADKLRSWIFADWKLHHVLCKYIYRNAYTSSFVVVVGFVVVVISVGRTANIISSWACATPLQKQIHTIYNI